jgi:peptidoglycan hydrolase-like protein with peptidoglycan-binding domain
MPSPPPPASIAPAPEPPAPAPPEEAAPATPAKPSVETAPRPESQSRTAQAQRLLGRLGYNAGLPDGVGGPRTQSAIRAFQQANGMRVDGKVSDQLIAALADKVEEQDYRLGRYGRRAGEGAENKSEPGLVTSLFSGLQRLMGREFDSVRQAGELRAYCLTHADTWIYDEGTSEFVFCDDVNRGAVGTRGSGGRSR